MRVLCVIDDLGSGGAQRQLVSVACGLAARGHHVELFTYHALAHFRSTLDAAGIRVHLRVKTRRFAIAPVRALRRLITEGSFDTVLAFLETPVVYAELATRGLRGVRLVVGERSTVPGGRASVARVLKSQLHRAANAVVTNSYAQRDWMAHRFPFLAPKLSVVWNGIDLEEFRPGVGRPSGGELRLLGIGRIAPEKNLPRLIEAVACCQENGIALRVDWVGREDAAAEADAVKRLVIARGLESNWRWWGERRDTPERLRACDALIAPSLFEGLPNAVCEALASGVPVLASAVSDNARLAPEGEHGFLFDPGETTAIAGAIARFAALASPDRLAMGQRGRAFAERHLGMATCIDSYERLLTSLKNDG